MVCSLNISPSVKYGIVCEAEHHLIVSSSPAAQPATQLMFMTPKQGKATINDQLRSKLLKFEAHEQIRFRGQAGKLPGRGKNVGPGLHPYQCRSLQSNGELAKDVPHHSPYVDLYSLYVCRSICICKGKVIRHQGHQAGKRRRNHES